MELTSYHSYGTLSFEAVLDVWKLHIHVRASNCGLLTTVLYFLCSLGVMVHAYLLHEHTVLAPALKSPRSSNINAVRYEPLSSRTVVGRN